MSDDIQKFKVIRKPEVLDILNLSETSLHRQVKAKTLPPSFSLGCRAVGWFEHEIISIIKARAAGKAEADIQQMVDDQIKARSEL